MSDQMASGAGGGGRGARLRVAILAAGGALLLLIPLVAMRFTREVNWTAGDFAVMAAMLSAAGLAFELGMRRSVHIAYRAGIALSVATGFLIVWSALAVGIVRGAAFLGDLFYLGVIGVVLAGAMIGRFRPRGMARALLAGAAMVGLAAAIALITGPSSATPQLLGVSGLFAAMLLACAWLFARAAPRG